MQIDFYILEQTGKQRAMLFVCQLIEKLHLQKKRVYVHTNSSEEADSLDRLLWTFKDDSFLPHAIRLDDEKIIAPIQLGYGNQTTQDVNAIINLHAQTPPFLNAPEQLIEIVFADPAIQQLARERYKKYRDQGFEINTHKLKANEL